MDGFMRVPGGRYPCRGVQLARNLKNPPTMVMRRTVRNELRTLVCPTWAKTCYLKGGNWK